jgi:predicted Abi (CAAX) family protease
VSAGLGSLTLNYLLYQSKLVPRFLSVWGLIGAALVLLYGLLNLFSLDPLNMLSSILTILTLPIAAQEMVFAVWLIVKGFNPAAIASLSAKTDTN